MNKLYVLILIIFIAFLSCDGRDRVFKTNEEILIENKLLDSFSESIKYFPETYSEVETDTILNNGFKVKIKTYTDMNSSVLIEFTQDTINYKRFYREFLSNIIVRYNNDKVFEEKINVDFLAKNSIESKDFLNGKVILKNIRMLNQMESDNVVIDIWCWKIDTEIFLPLQLIIDKKGKFTLNTEGELEF